MPEGLLIDAARFGHFTGFALGIGAGCFADYSIVRKLESEISTCDIGNLEQIHKIVWTGLALLWVSGLAILFARTGFIWSEFSPKLLTKLLVVGVLTLNAFLLGMIAMPILRRNLNHSYMAFSLEDKTILCVLAAISTCSWFSGLVLGIFSALKPADFSIMLPMFGILYTIAIFGAVVFAVLLHIVWERRGEKASAVLMADANADMFREMLVVQGTNDSGERSVKSAPAITAAK